MNAHSTLVKSGTDQAFLGQLAHVERWRAQCVQHFSVLEQSIEDLLLHLRKSPKGGRKVKPGQPIGPAFAHLRELVGTNGPFAQHATALSKRLGQFATAMEWRAHLTHGDLKLWRGRDGQWLLTLMHRAPGDEVQRLHAITWKDALEIQRDLEKQVPAFRKSCASLAAALA